MSDRSRSRGDLVASLLLTLAAAAAAYLVFVQVLHAMWLGPIGVVVATPLLVVLVVSVQILYLRGVLGDDAEVAGS